MWIGVGKEVGNTWVEWGEEIYCMQNTYFQLKKKTRIKCYEPMWIPWKDALDEKPNSWVEKDILSQIHTWYIFALPLS